MSENNAHKDFFVKHGVKIVVGVVLLLVLAALVSQMSQSSKLAEKTQAEYLGKALSLIYQGKDAEALEELEDLLQSNKLKALSLSKAALLAGNIHYKNGSFDKAEALFKKSLNNTSNVDLISAAAMHGLASVAIEQKNYALAAEQLEKFILKYGKRTGNLSDRYTKNEGVDPVPTVPDALWKLSLVYYEMGNADKAKSSAELLLKRYGDSQLYSDRAKKFLASL